MLNQSKDDILPSPKKVKTSSKIYPSSFFDKINKPHVQSQECSSRKQIVINEDQDKSVSDLTKLIQKNPHLDMQMKFYTAIKTLQKLVVNHGSKYHAKGKLFGNNLYFPHPVEFYGEFIGVFKQSENSQKETIYYFQGKITHIFFLNKDIVLQLLRKMQTPDSKSGYHMKGFFKGQFIKDQSIFDHLLVNNEQPSDISEQSSIKKHQSGHPKIIEYEFNTVEHFVPIATRFYVQQISQINLQQSSAQIYGTLYIEVILSQQIIGILKQKWKSHSQQTKYRLALDFNRDRHIPLPFYDTEDQQFEKTDDQSEYEWDDLWEGTYLDVKFDLDNNRISYTIETLFNSEIDNSHGSFYSPFNLNVLKIIIDFHKIEINNQNDDLFTKHVINFVCCDMKDIGPNKSKDHHYPYSPYTSFNQLQKTTSAINIQHHQNADNQKNYNILNYYPRHIDRVTKISKAGFDSQGEFKIATNRMFLFPYHKRTMINKNSLGESCQWTLAIQERQKYLQQIQVLQIEEGYYQAKRASMTGNHHPFQLHTQWGYVHIEIPLFKYPVIDMFRIFIPIVVLSVISLFIFEQENGSSGGITKISTRIASACSLLIAYTAMVPTIRQNLPPTPSISLIQILIYLSTLPNFLAIMSSFVMWNVEYTQFFNTYRAFVDPLFLASFVLTGLSLLTLTIMMIVYARADFQSIFTFPNFKSQLKLSSLRQPAFLNYINQVKAKRSQYTFNQELLPQDLQSQRRSIDLNTLRSVQISVDDTKNKVNFQEFDDLNAEFKQTKLLQHQNSLFEE